MASPAVNDHQVLFHYITLFGARSYRRLIPSDLLPGHKQILVFSEDWFPQSPPDIVAVEMTAKAVVKEEKKPHPKTETQTPKAINHNEKQRQIKKNHKIHELENIKPK